MLRAARAPRAGHVCSLVFLFVHPWSWSLTGGESKDSREGWQVKYLSIKCSVIFFHLDAAVCPGS